MAAQLLERASKLFPDVPIRIALANTPFNVTICWPFAMSGNRAGLQSRFLVQDGACIVALHHETHEPFLIRQTRITGQGSVESVEFPCGGCEEGENSLEGGLRELREESGVVPTKEAEYILLFANKNPVIGPLITSQHAHLVTSARMIEKPSDDEATAVFTMPLNQIITQRHEITMADPLLTFCLAFLVQHELRERNLQHLLT